MTMAKLNLLTLLFVSFITSLTAVQSVPIWSCPTANITDEKNDLVTLVHVDWNNGSVGLIQTPHFPHPVFELFLCWHLLGLGCIFYRLLYLRSTLFRCSPSTVLIKFSPHLTILTGRKVRTSLDD